MIPLYFDPGTGALIVQFFSAIVASILIFYKSILFKIKTIFGLNKKDNEEDLFDRNNDNVDSNVK